MGKYSIECPNCGSFNQASTGFFSKKRITCGSCGEEFDVKPARLTSRICPECGSVIVCDQAKMKDKKCPVCGHEISLRTDSVKYKMAIVNCPQCACAVEVDTTKNLVSCPLCDCVIDVKKELARASLVKDGKISVIQYEGSGSLVWKHPVEDFNFGSILIVHESQEAIFFLNGKALDSFGPGRHVLETENLPVLKNLYHIGKGEQTPFHAEVYFVDLSMLMGLKWGTDSRVKFIEPHTGLPLDIGVSGELNLRVSNPRKLLINLVGTTKGINWDGDAKDFTKSVQDSFRAVIVSSVKVCLASCIKELRLNILEIDEHASLLADAIKKRILPELEQYGITVPDFYITAFSLPEDNPNFRRYKEQMAKAYLAVEEERINTEIALAMQKRKVIEMQTQAQLDIIKAQGEAEVTKLTGLADAEVMRAKGYTQKDVLASEVQKAYAEGIGNMGPKEISGGGGVSSDMMQMVAGLKMADILSGQMDNMFLKNTSQETWDCVCGKKGITSEFCPDCGRRKSSSREEWNCVCGERNLTSNFCPKCGRRRPENDDN